MIKIIIVLLSFSLIAQASKPVGFLWYNEVKLEAKTKTKYKTTPFNQLSYQKRDKVLHFYTMEALHRAHYTKSMEDMRVFLALQDYWLKESTHFKNLFHKTMLYYPEYDYTVTHPTSNIGTKLLDKERANKSNQALRRLAKTHGLLFFYRGRNMYDKKQIPIIKDFCHTYKFSLIPVSIDKVIAKALPNSRLNEGQAQSLNINFFPAILLINPKTQKTYPVAFGLTTQDSLEANIMSVINEDKAQ